MWKLWLGVLLFTGPHLVSTLLPGLRAQLARRVGENAYKGIFALLSLAGLVFLALGYLNGRSGPNALDIVYEPWDGARHFMMLLVLVGFILMFANGSKGYIRATVKHPFSLGIILWSIGHLLVNGEKAVVVIFAMFLVLSLLDIIMSVARGKMPDHVPNWRHDVRAVAVGVVLYLVFAFGFHPYVLNIPVMG